MHTEKTDHPDLFQQQQPTPYASEDAHSQSAGSPAVLSKKYTQPTFAEVSDEYKAFEAKFKPRKTTDDCYTPDVVFNAVRDWVCARYSLNPAAIIRPFWPGGDYERADYPTGCVVLDNPPFSILSRILRFYLERNIRFFLFAPALTCFAGNLPATSICAGASVTYANGAVVNTSFITNLEDPDVVAMSSPELHDLVEAASAVARREQVRHVPKLAMPIELITAARMNYYSVHHTEFSFRRSESVFVRKLDNWPSGIFGGGFLVNRRAAAERAAAERAAAERAAAERAAAERAAAERAAAERAAAERIELSPREKAMLDLLG